MKPTLLAIALATLTFPVAADEAPGGEPAAQAAECLAEAVYFEARGTSDTSREAVAHVVVNRAEAEEFPDTVCEVVADGCQFSYMCDGKPETLAEAEDRAEAIDTAEQVLEGEAPDPTDGALFFHGRSVSPDWAQAFDRTTEIGGHIFYR